MKSLKAITIWVIGWVSTFILFFNLGCALFQKDKIKPPKVTVQTVEVQSFDNKGATLIFDLKVDNPNPFELKIKQLTYDVAISGKPFTTGKLDEGAQVGALQSSTVRLPIAVKYSDIFNSVLGFLQNQTAPYEIKGSALVGWVNVPFKHSGEIKFEP